MAVELSPFEREVRDTLVKYTASGVAVSIIAIVAFSPSGFGDWVGQSFASSLGMDSTASAESNAYAILPAYPAPMSADELSRIRGQLASTEASLAIMRAATDDKIEHVRQLAAGDGLVTFAPSRAAPAPADMSLRLTLSEPTSFDEAPVEAYVVAPAPEALPVVYSNYGVSSSPVAYRDPHLELAELLLAHESL
ncbi:MAG: hypothetical protein ABL889_05845 [Terricaulis sp.]